MRMALGVLEQIIADPQKAPSPKNIISSALEAAIREAAIAEFAGKTSRDIADLGNRFAIQYAIGTPLGDVMEQNGVRWLDGSVSYSCELVFNS
jgi:hypothetical protein